MQQDGRPGELAVSGGVSPDPGKLLRIGAMVREMLEEVRRAPLDADGRRLLKRAHDLAVAELSEALTPALREELREMALPLDDEVPTESELRVAQAQLMGWLEGLFHGIQAAMYAQSLQARAQLEELQRRAEERARPGQPGYL